MKIDLKFDPLLDRQPVQVFQNRGNVVILSGICDKPSRLVLKSLQPLYFIGGQTIENGITKVDTRADK